MTAHIRATLKYPAGTELVRGLSNIIRGNRLLIRTDTGCAPGTAVSFDFSTPDGTGLYVGNGTVISADERGSVILIQNANRPLKTLLDTISERRRPPELFDSADEAMRAVDDIFASIETDGTESGHMTAVGDMPDFLTPVPVTVATPAVPQSPSVAEIERRKTQEMRAFSNLFDPIPPMDDPDKINEDELRSIIGSDGKPYIRLPKGRLLSRRRKGDAIKPFERRPDPENDPDFVGYMFDATVPPPPPQIPAIQNGYRQARTANITLKQVISEQKSKSFEAVPDPEEWDIAALTTEADTHTDATR